MKWGLAKAVSRLRRLWQVGRDRAGERNQFGYRCERVAERFLKKRGMKVVARNFEDHFGEIDLILVDRKTVVFVEVKARKSDAGGAGYEAVDDAKRQKIVQTALHFLKRHDLLECAYRFDIVSIEWPDSQTRPRIEYFENAFQPPGRNQMFG